MTNNVFRGLLEFLKGEYGRLSQSDIAAVLKIQQSQVSTYKTNAPTRRSWWRKRWREIYHQGYEKGRREATGKLRAPPVPTAATVTNPVRKMWKSPKF